MNNFDKIRNTKEITKDELLKIFEDEYVESGYLYSGSIGQNTLWSNEKAYNLAYELVKEGQLQIRDCEAHSFELSASIRQRLIKENHLSEKWQEKAPYFYPNNPDPRIGEIASVKQELRMKL